MRVLRHRSLLLSSSFAVALAGAAILEACADNGTASTDDGSDAAIPGLDSSLRADRAAPPDDEDSSTGEDSSTSTDAGTDSGPKDSGHDAADAAPVDAGPTTSLFFLGDFAVNNTVQLGDALLPTAMANPVVITDGVKTAKQVLAFDALADGTKIVVAADLTVTGRFDLVVANRNGTGAVTIATMPATGNVTDITISPDGTKVAFIADADTDDAFDAYVVPIAGGAAPVKVSPVHTDAATDAQSISWSRNSVYVAIAGDFTVDKKNELYITDTSVAAPVPVAALPESMIPAPPGTSTDGVSTALRPLWTDGGKACVKAELTGVAPATFRLYCVAANGTGFAEPTHFPALPAQLGTYGLSPDGLTIAFSSDSKTTDAYEIYTMLADDSAAPARITSGTITSAAAGAFRGPAFTIPLTYSPDGTKIGFVADILTDNRNELYVVASDGATTEKRLAIVGTDGDDARDVTGFAWSPDNLTMGFICDHRVDNNFELFKLANVTTAGQIPTLVRGVVASGDITDVAWRP